MTCAKPRQRAALHTPSAPNPLAAYGMRCSLSPPSMLRSVTLGRASERASRGRNASLLGRWPHISLPSSSRVPTTYPLMLGRVKLRLNACPGFQKVAVALSKR